MTHRRLGLILTLAALAWTGLQAQQPLEKRDPLGVDKQEQVDVRLVLVDVVVLDRQDRTVPDLQASDFELTVDGKPRPIDTLDTRCDGGAADDPRAVRRPERREPAADDVRRQIVLALDYLHLGRLERTEVLEQARWLVKGGATGNDRIMVAALNGGLRIEQPFTADRDKVADVLKRMEYDISLWQPSFSHLTEASFFAGMSALMEVLDAVPGSKALVLFSNSPAPSDERDPEFAALAAAAAAARCAVYPVHAAGLTTLRPG